MTVPLVEVSASYQPSRERVATPRRYLMCPPRYFDVTYSINPWMDPTKPVVRARANEQWQHLVETYQRLGHQVELIEPEVGSPDMVFSANSAIVADGRVLTSRFRHSERAREQRPYTHWFHDHQFAEVGAARAICEGEGDVAVVGSVIFAAWGFRTSRRAHQEIGDFFGRRVVSLRLCDPRYYHLDMALCVLDDHTALFHPRAFSARSRSALERAFADAIPVNAHDARSLALNAVCDGHHVLIPAGASRVCDELRERGFYPIEVEMAEFAKAGGGIKCCTLELR